MPSPSLPSSHSRSILTRPIPLPRFPSAYRSFGLFGKDLVHHAKVVVTMVVASCFALCLPWMAEVFSGRSAEFRMQVITNNASSIFLAMFIACAYVFGLVLSADEVESRTLSFIDTLPARRYTHFVHKLLAGMVMLLVWAVSAAVLMGLLSENGLKLLHALFHEKLALFSTVLDLPSSGTMTIVQSMSLLLTGLACGLLFQNLASSAIIGIIAYCCWLVVISRVFVQKYHTPTTIEAIHLAALLGWSMLMIAAYPRLFSQAQQLRGDAAFRVEASSPLWQRITNWLQYRRSYKSTRLFDAPHRYLLRLLIATLSILAIGFPPLMGQLKGIGSGEQLAVIALIVGCPTALALIVGGAWLPEERFAPKYHVYALPVSREQLFWPRTRAVLFSAFAVCCSLLFGILLLSITMYFQKGELDPFDFPLEIVFMIVGVLLSIASLSAMFRLFYSNRLIAAVLSGMVLFVWILAAGHSWFTFAESLGYKSPPRPETPTMPFAAIGYAVWIIFVMTALPVLVAYLGFCKSRLLEVSERTRGSVSLVIFLLLIVWGSFFIGIVPSQVYTILFVR